MSTSVSFIVRCLACEILRDRIKHQNRLRYVHPVTLRTTLVVFFCLAAVVPSIRAQDYSHLLYTDLLYPGSWNTRATGVDGGYVVGTHDADSRGGDRLSGFLYDGFQYSSLNVPGSIQTQPQDLDGNQIVGWHQEATFGLHGWVYDGSTYTSIDVPNGQNSQAFGISGNRIVGSYYTSEGDFPGSSGFIYDGSTYQSLRVPDSFQTGATAIDGNLIVGWYIKEDFPGAAEQGFIYDGSSYQDLQFPGSIGTIPRGISGSTIVGQYFDESYVSHGFAYDGQTWTTLTGPNEVPTLPGGIDGQTIVGEYQPGPGALGFVANVATESKYEFTGEVISVDDADGWMNNTIQVGMQVNGSFNFFNRGFQKSISLSSPWARYQFFNGHGPNLSNLPELPVGLHVEIDGNTYESGDGRIVDPFNVQITNDNDGSVFGEAGDTYIVSSLIGFPANFLDLACDQVVDPECRFFSYADAWLSLKDSSGTALSSLDFTNVPSLAAFDSAIGTIGVRDGNGLPAFATARFRITSLRMVPEPSLSVAMGGASLVLAVIKRRSLGQRSSAAV